MAKLIDPICITTVADLLAYISVLPADMPIRDPFGCHVYVSISHSADPGGSVLEVA